MDLLLLQTETFHSIGGMQMYNRALCRAAADLVAERGGSVRVLCLNDRTEDLDSRYLSADCVSGFGGDRRAFIVAALSAATARPSRLFLGHVQLLPLAPVLRLLGARRQSCFLYGIEAWARWSRLQRLGVRFCDQFVSISDYTAREARKANEFATEVRLLPCTLDPFWRPPTEARPRAEADGPRLFSVARLDALERYKGIDTVIDALPEVRKRQPTVRYWVAGDGSDRPRLETLARERGVSDLVDFLGRIPDDELQRRYAACDLFVLPSGREGFGIVFLEAASYRQPSLGAAAGGTPEVIRDGVTGGLVPYGNPAALAELLDRLLADPQALERMGEAAFEDVESRFGFQAFVRRFADLAS
ncbi:MAG: glycosyltransferase family 4 protein [Myxococcales bacterium]